MEPIYRRQFTVDSFSTDPFGRLRRSMILRYAQQVAGDHCDLLSLNYEALAEKGLFWAVVRNRIQVTRLPRQGQTVTLETWPMPTTRTAYPRATVAYDEQGQELFRSVSLWVLMDRNSRTMVLPGKSGVEVPGTLRGTELATPRSLSLKDLELCQHRKVCFSDLDLNGHMNNARYLDWIEDLLPSHFHRDNQPMELSLCYINEAREADEMDLRYGFQEGNLFVDILRSSDRIFSASISYGSV